MTIQRSAPQIDAAEWPQAKGELNRILELLAQGALVQYGIKFDNQRTSQPTDAPAAGTPNLVMYQNAGVWTLTMWNGTVWTDLGAGGGGGGASTADAFVTIGHPGDLTAERALTGDASVTVTDGGANTTVTVSRAALTGDVTASAGANATTIANNVVTDAKLRQGGADSVIGRSANSVGNVADISAASDGDVLRRAAGVLGFGAIPEASVTNLTTDLSGKAATTEPYVTIGNTAGLSAERALAIEATVLTLTDGGANASATIGVAANGITDAKLRQGGADSVIGRSANSLGNVADISAGSDGDVLRRAAGVLGFGAIPEASVTNLVSDLAAKVPTTRTLTTTAPLTGGGDLSADRTLGISDFVGSGASHARGAVPDPGASAGTTKYLREDASWSVPPSGGSLAATTVEVNHGATPIFRGSFTITDAAITGTSKVLCWQAPGPYTSKGTLADEAEMQPVQVIAVAPAAGSATVYFQTPPMLAPIPSGVSGGDGGGPNTAASVAGRRTEFDIVQLKRVGKVMGNVKYSYLVA